MEAGWNLQFEPTDTLQWKKEPRCLEDTLKIEDKTIRTNRLGNLLKCLYCTVHDWLSKPEKGNDDASMDGYPLDLSGKGWNATMTGPEHSKATGSTCCSM